METIFAVSSGPPPAAIAVMRISGPLAIDTARLFCGTVPAPRRAALRAVKDPATGELLDRALVLCFPGPATATGEDLIELHLHGGRAIVAAVAVALARMPGLRAAEPGEFTRRALASGRIDLAEAEGLGDLLAAETQGQRRRALAMAEGVVSRAIAGWSDRLLETSAVIEAMLDFADEDDVVASNALAKVAVSIEALAGDIGQVLSAPPVERLRDGIRVTLAGPRNSGKSTLINALAGREVAIVSSIAGTTRDRIEAPVISDGIAYVLTDTAGLADHTDDPVEAIGIARAHDAMTTADILLWLDDDPPPAGQAATIWLYPRADDRPPADNGLRLAVSAKTGVGIPALWRAIGNAAAELLPREDQLAVNQRQRDLLIECTDELRRATMVDDMLLVAEHLRLARRALDRMTGATHVEAMLDTLFGRFCIGK
jgi:tRNA modification GTPase